MRVHGPTAELSHAVGECMGAWANVELKLQYLFRAILGCKPAIADTVLGIPHSFERKSAMVHAVVKLRLEAKPELLADWNVLYKYLGKMSSKRNEIAHATVFILHVGPKPVAVLSPYYKVSQAGANIEADEVLRRFEAFRELDRALSSLSEHIINLDASAKPVELVARLRAESGKPA